MNREAIQEIARISGVQKIPVSASEYALSEDGKLVREDGGAVAFHEVPPKPRSYRVESLAGLVAAVRQIHEVPEDGADQGVAAIMVSRHLVAAVFDEAGSRSEVAKMGLTTSIPFHRLTEWESEPWRGLQRDAFDLLRSEFPGAVADAFLASVRNVKTRNSAEAEARVAHDGESLGVKSTAESSALDGGIPEEVDFRVPVYRNASGVLGTFDETVRVAVSFDAEDRSFTFKTIAGQIDAAFSRAHESIQAEIKRLIGDPVPGVVILPDCRPDSVIG